MTDPREIRTIFMGTSVFAEQILTSLLEARYNIIAVYTQPDKKVGRTQTIQKSAVKITAEKNNIPIFEPQKFDEAAIDQLKKLLPEIIIVAAYGKILPTAALELPRFGAINVHTSLLPKYRGPSPIQNAVLDGEKETGSTIMRMDAGIDTGDILSQEKIAIGPNETTPELSKKLATLSSELLLKTIPLHIEGKIIPRKQNDSAATFCKLIKKSDGQIFWSDSAKNIYNRYRAFFPWPGIYTFWENNGVKKRIKLTKITLGKEMLGKGRQTGEAFQLDEKFAIQAGTGIIIIEELQIEGKSNMTIKDFLNGHKNFIGSILR